MTRKQALYKVLDAVDDKAIRAKIIEILDDMPLTNWSEQSIFDTIDQFAIDNNRLPHVSDFKKKGLPPHTVIKLRFGMNLKEFLEKYYTSKKLCSSRLYHQKTKDEWKDIFIRDYIKNKPRSAEGHNKARTKGTPSWQTISVMFGITSGWIGLLFAG